MNVLLVAAPWFFAGLAGGFVMNGLIGLIISRGSGGQRWEGD